MIVNIENADDTINVLLETLADTRRELQRYKGMYRLTLDELVELKRRKEDAVQISETD